DLVELLIGRIVRKVAFTHEVTAPRPGTGTADPPAFRGMDPWRVPASSTAESQPKSQTASTRANAGRRTYLNQMRWYSRLIGWRSRPTSAPSNMRFTIASDVRTSVPKTAMSITSWNTAPATATA